MNDGEIFYIAVAGDPPRVLGFSSYHRDGAQHRTAVYVRGEAARQGIGSALFRRAEADALAAGATAIDIAASLVAVDFYAAHGFEAVGRGEHRLRSGRRMACVFMRKTLGNS